MKKEKKNKVCGSSYNNLIKSPEDDDTSSGGRVRQPISGLGYGRGYLVAIASLTAV